MWKLAFIVTLALVAPAAVYGQQSNAAGAAAPGQNDQTIRIKLPPVTVTAEKVPEDAQKSPVSVTAVTKETLESSVPRSVSDAADIAPNVWFNEFSARKLSNPRFRGIGSSPSNPGITTFIDGVPQLNANSSSIELADVDQIEFVRGPQSALFGRNSIGGLINISSARPSLTDWAGSLIAPFGNFGAAEEVRRAHAKQRFERAAQLHLSVGEHRPVDAPRQHGTCHEHSPSHRLGHPFLSLANIIHLRRGPTPGAFLR